MQAIRSILLKKEYHFMQATVSVLQMNSMLRVINSNVSTGMNKHQNTCQRYMASKRGTDDDRYLDFLTPAVVPAQNIEDVETHVGTELTGVLNKPDMIILLNKFYRSQEIKQMSLQQGMEHSLFRGAFLDFRKFCANSNALPNDLHVVISDLLRTNGSPVELFPYFLRHARKLYPHLECLDDLRQVSDLTQPASWFTEARSRQRKIIIHAGPTNSGKTHHAFQRFLEAKSGIYCGPLKLLATEICNRSNDEGLLCDLVTGEERRMADPEGKKPAEHVSCTVEMTDITRHVEVAIIDEIQMLRDVHRGWAWTRALLGVNANEVHVCGESTVIDIIKDISMDTGDEVEVRKYQRLTPIEYMETALQTFDKIQPGDCLICFNKNAIYQASRELERRNIECAVIYGSLPASTKLAQAAKFNDPDHSCKVLLATDAVGMGLNLNIKRVVFYSLTKMTENIRGEKEIDLMTPSQALQIAGRCGRFGTTHAEKGYVTTFNQEDIKLLHGLLSTPIQPIEQAGLHPIADQIELFAFHLPQTSLSNLIDIFLTLSTVDMEKYFMCNMEPFKQLADIIEHVPLALRTRYVFCCAPIPLQSTFVASTFLKFARRFSNGDILDFDWLGYQIGWPFQKPRTITELTHLEAVIDVLELYRWLSYRFKDQFPDSGLVKDVQDEIDQLILAGIESITKLINSADMDKDIAHQDARRKNKVNQLANKRNLTLSQKEQSELQRVINRFAAKKNNKKLLDRKNIEED